MDDLQLGLYLDLKRRCTLLEARLKKPLGDADLKVHAAYAAESLQLIREDIDKILQHGAQNTGSPQDLERLAKLYALNYRTLNRRVNIVQNYLVPPLERFNASDRKMTRYVQKLAKDISWPGKPPIVLTNSDAGYMTFTGFYLIQVPAAEDESLLALPDLVHEMGHILLEEHEQVFLNEFEKVLAKYVTETKDSKGKQINQDLYGKWMDNWVKEFVSDMIAAYVTGPAFGYQHIRLCSGYPARAFRAAVTHPADDARARGAVAVLKKLGRTADADDVSQRWQDYLKSSGDTKVPSYDIEAPDVLIDALASSVVDACKKLGIRAYTAPQLQNDAVGLMAEAWKRFHSDPVGFAKWEAQRLRQLWNDLGLRASRAPKNPLPAPNSKPTQLSRCGATVTVISNQAQAHDGAPKRGPERVLAA